MKRFIVASVKIEIDEETDYGRANMQTPARDVVMDYLRTPGGAWRINVQIDERKA
jgi:hypothetical protein